MVGEEGFGWSRQPVEEGCSPRGTGNDRVQGWLLCVKRSSLRSSCFLDPQAQKSRRENCPRTQWSSCGAWPLCLRLTPSQSLPSYPLETEEAGFFPYLPMSRRGVLLLRCSENISRSLEGLLGTVPNGLYLRALSLIFPHFTDEETGEQRS